ncbi:hypothetical protein [Savagea faecisuis]|uniref:Uncharacterized protein n=1 Tax=Savagea faecisuis TaxID=1274803 RepID=A0ABW3GUH4_9BACL
MKYMKVTYRFVALEEKKEELLQVFSEAVKERFLLYKELKQNIQELEENNEIKITSIEEIRTAMNTYVKELEKSLVEVQKIQKDFRISEIENLNEDSFNSFFIEKENFAKRLSILDNPKFLFIKFLYSERIIDYLKNFKLLSYEDSNDYQWIIPGEKIRGKFYSEEREEIREQQVKEALVLCNHLETLKVLEKFNVQQIRSLRVNLMKLSNTKIQKLLYLYQASKFINFTTEGV